MYQFGDRVITRTGMRYRVVRCVGSHPPYSYLLSGDHGQPHIMSHADLRLAAAVEQWLFKAPLWDRVERRQGERRQGERRGGKPGRADQVRAERRLGERRRAERRWLSAPSESTDPVG